MTTAASTGGMAAGATTSRAFSTKDKPTEVRLSNIVAAKAVADVVRTSLGPKGMDKMVRARCLFIILTG